MRRGGNRSAWTGAAIAASTISAAAWMDGAFDLPLAVAALGAIAAGGLLSIHRRPRIEPLPESAEPNRHSIAEALLTNIPDPVILIDRRSVVIEANPAARALLPALKLGHPLSFALRSPDVLDGIEEVLRSGAPLTTQYVTRVPMELAFEV